MGNTLFVADSSEDLRDGNPLTPYNTQDHVPGTATPQAGQDASY
jgi:hypothetical protein